MVIFMIFLIGILKKNEIFTSNHVFSCKYSSLNQVNKEKLSTTAKLKHEITEIALIEAPLFFGHHL